MKSFICETCGTQYAPSESPPAHCPVCEDERQYVGWNGQILRFDTKEGIVGFLIGIQVCALFKEKLRTQWPSSLAAFLAADAPAAEPRAKSSSKKGNLTRPCCTSRGSRREPPALAREKIARPVAGPPGFYRDRT